MVKRSFKFWLDLFFKIAMLIFGIINFFDYLDFIGKVLAVVLLFLLWKYFDPIKLIFGRSKKWMNYVVLIIFYILILDTFVNIIVTSDTAAGEFQNFIFPVDNFLNNSIPSVYSPVRNFFIDLRTGSINVSEFSSTVGFILLVFMALHLTFFLKYEKKSMIYPLVKIAFTKDKFWNKLNSNKLTIYSIFTFGYTILALLIFSHYFFNLVNQWMIVTIGNSTFIIAFFFAIKDIKNSGIKILDKMGSFDESLIFFLRKIFNHRRYFLIGFSILLAFHYLTDVNLFFIPYLIPNIPIDEYYINLIGSGNHTPLLTLLTAETASTFIEGTVNVIVYAFSTIGAFFLFFIPIAFIFMSVSKKNIKDYLENKHHRILLYLMFISSTIFILAPWISTTPITTDVAGNLVGIYGVDFQTTQISTYSISIRNLFLTILSLSIFCYVFSEKKWLQEYSITITFLYSLVFLGSYVWKFFTSTAFYYFNLLSFSISELNITLFFLFLFLLFMESMFYIGGFLYMGYKLSHYIITQKTKNIVTDNTIIIWTIILMVIPIISLFKGTISAITTSVILVTSLFLFTLAMYKEFTKGFKDDFLLSITLIIMLFEVIIIFELLGKYFLTENLVLLATIILLFVFSMIILPIFKIKLNIKKLTHFDYIPIIAVGAIFGFLFFLFPDPFLVTNKLFLGQAIIYILIAAISEEIIFRGVVLNISEKAFSMRRAILIQSLVFTLVHFIGLKSILQHYSNLGLQPIYIWINIGFYAILLFSFGMFSASIYIKSKNNIVSPIVLHFLVNLIPYLIYAII